MKEAGILAPVIVCKVNENMVLVDGEHRLDEALKNGFPVIDAVVFEGDMVDVLTKNLFLDHTRGKTPPSDMVKVIGALYNDYNLDSDQIKEKTGLTRDYIEKLIRIYQAGTSVQQALDEGVIGVGHAFEISRLPYALQQDELIAKHQVWRFTVKELHDQIDNVLKEMELVAEEGQPEAVTKPRPVAKYHCEGCKAEVEPRYLRPVMLCPNCFGEVWRLARSRPESEAETPVETGGS